MVIFQTRPIVLLKFLKPNTVTIRTRTKEQYLKFKKMNRGSSYGPDPLHQWARNRELSLSEQNLSYCYTPHKGFIQLSVPVTSY